MRRMRVVALALAPLLLSLAGAGQAPAAEREPSDALAPLPTVTYPAGLSPSERRLYAAIFGDPGAAAPRGTSVADTGFRPRPDGFSFLNYGEDFRVNQRFFAQPRALRAGRTPAREVPLRPRDLRAVFGDGVCLPEPEPPPTGDCVLTEAADQVRRDARAWGKAGHCYGMTMLAGGLFSGAIARSSIGAGDTNVMTTLSSGVQRAIGRFTIGGHFGIPAVVGEPVDAVLAQLRSLLTLGSAPLLLVMYGSAGGHAVLPFSVLDRGEGRADIAVYDPNFPGQPRAIHVDIASGSWSYDGSALPSATPLAWSSAAGSDLGLMPVAAGLGVRSCPFCPRSAPIAGETDAQAVITFSPVRAENGAVYRSLTFLDAQGKPLDPSLYEVTPAVDGGGDWVNGPIVRMRTTESFTVALDGAMLTRPEPLTITSSRPGDVSSIRIEALRQGASSIVGFGLATRGLLVRTSPTRRMTAVQALDTPTASYRFTATQDTGGIVGQLALRVIERERSATIAARGDGRATMPVHLALRSRTPAGTSIFRATRILLPRHARIVIRYRSWQGPTGAPAAWIDRGSDGTLDTPIPLVRVRTS